MVVLKCDNCGNQRYDGDCFDTEPEIICIKGHWQGWNDYNAISEEADINGDPLEFCSDYVGRKEDSLCQK
jgi:hypothetical protein